MGDTVMLKEILLEEKNILEKILSLEKATQDLLVRRDAPKLEALNREKGQLIKIMHDLEARRQHRQQEKDLLPGWEGLRQELLGILTALGRVQKINERLLQHNLHFIHQVTAAFYPAAETFYAASGEKENGTPFPPGILNSSV
ncbi:MAG TPA: hypothetical protein DCQ14_01545 [Firmicutes bacterium]|nr:hypothetical protein [Bacillota bacterium]